MIFNVFCKNNFYGPEINPTSRKIKDPQNHLNDFAGL